MLQSVVRNDDIKANTIRQIRNARVNTNVSCSCLASCRIHLYAEALFALKSAQQESAAATKIQHNVIGLDKWLELPPIQDCCELPARALPGEVRGVVIAARNSFHKVAHRTTFSTEKVDSSFRKAPFKTLE